MATFDTTFEGLQKVMDLGRQYWLLGAGVSYDANVPLILPLTRRIEGELKAKDKELFDAIKSELSTQAHVETILSHLGDLMSLADRSGDRKATIAKQDATFNELEHLYQSILEMIGSMVRYGYREGAIPGKGELGTVDKPIVKVDQHLRFVQALFGGRANLEPRSTVTFFTSNYDTLLEDALALCRRTPIDGFRGSAMGFWDGAALGDDGDLSAKQHRVYKLHGSVDWSNDKTYGIIRCRYGVTYLADSKQILIYPQATKYVETQKDPFAVLFTGFRRALRSPADNVLLSCGYSFGDNHINNEIEAALSAEDSKSTLVVFAKEDNDPANAGKTNLCPLLEKWRQDERFGSSVYVASDKALYRGNARYTHPTKPELDWWSFSGLTQFLEKRGL